MNRRPQAPLDAEERALAAALPGVHGRSEPDAALDARILAAAHAAVETAPAPRLRPRWLTPLGLAASLCLAVGLAWRLRPPAVPPLPAPAADVALALPQAVAESEATTAMPASAKRVTDATPVPATAGALPAAAEALPAAATQTRRQRAETASAGAADTAIAERTAPAHAQPAPSEPAPPAPPAPPPAPPADAASASAKPSAFPAPPAAAAAPGANAEAAPDTITVSGTALPRRQASSGGAPMQAEAERRADKSATAARRAAETIAADAPEDDVPPATMDAPEAREAWLRRIGILLDAGRIDEARESLAEFRRRYPKAPLPPELEALHE